MERRSTSALFLSFLVSALLFKQEAHGEILYANTTSVLVPYQTNPFRVAILSNLRVVCPDPAYGLFRVSEQAYGNCSNSDGPQEIGQCANTGEISQLIFSVLLPGNLVWEIDTTYYLIFYGTGRNTAPCNNGYKFKVFVYNSTTVTPTPTVMPVSSSSVVITSSSSSVFSQFMAPSFSQTTIHAVSPSSTEAVTRPIRERSSSSSASLEIKSTKIEVMPTRTTSVLFTEYLTPTVDGVSGANSTTASLTLALSVMALLLLLLS